MLSCNRCYYVLPLTGAIDYRKQVAGADGLSPSGSAIPVHPDVTFKRLPFYDIMGELLKPTSLGECHSRGVEIPCLTCPTWSQFIQGKSEISMYLSWDKYNRKLLQYCIS